MRIHERPSGKEHFVVNASNFLLGEIALAVDALCLLIVLSLVWAMYQPGEGDAFVGLIFLGPFLLGIMLVASVIAVLCFRSLRRK